MARSSCRAAGGRQLRGAYCTVHSDRQGESLDDVTVLPERAANRSATTQPRDRRGGMPRIFSRARRATESGPQCHRRVRLGAGARSSAAGGRRARAGTAVRASARRADDDQGIVRRRRPADDLGRSHVELRRRARRPGRGAHEGCRRGDLRQDQRAVSPARFSVVQRHLRRHQQSVGSHAHARRILGRRRCRAGRGADGARSRQRHRRLDPQSRALQRRVRTQADVRHRRQRPAHAAADRSGVRPRRRRTARAQRRRPGPRVALARRTGPPQSRVARRTARIASSAARVSSRDVADRCAIARAAGDRRSLPVNRRSARFAGREGIGQRAAGVLC